MINLCFISGKIIEEVEFKFIYNPRTKSLSKKHTTIAIIKLQLENEGIVEMQGYDEIADFIYRNMQKGSLVIIYRKLRERHVEILQIEKIV